MNGFKCTKKEVETTVSVIGIKRTVKNIVWISKKLDMPVRTKSQNGSITELKNLKKGTPPGKYFEIPKGYKKVSNMMELMGMDMSKHGAKPSKTASENKEFSPHIPFNLPKEIKGLF